MTKKLNPTQTPDGILEVTPIDFKENGAGIKLIDVRRPEEFTGELGHIEGARLVTLGPELEAFLASSKKDEELVFVCRSGGRSGNATAFSLQAGFKRVYNLKGGMIEWNALGLPVAK